MRKTPRHLGPGRCALGIDKLRDVVEHEYVPTPGRPRQPCAPRMHGLAGAGQLQLEQPRLVAVLAQMLAHQRGELFQPAAEDRRRAAVRNR